MDIPKRHFLNPFEIGTEFEKQRKLLNRIQIFIGTIMVVCILTFFILIIDYFKFTSENRQRLYDKLEQIDKEISILNFRLDKLDDKLQAQSDTIIK